MGDLSILREIVTLTLGALAAEDCIATTSKIDASRTEGFRIMRSEIAVAYKGMTQGEGPIEVGMAFNADQDEIEQCIEADPQGMNDVGQVNLQHQANRPVFPIGVIQAQEVSGKLFEGAFRVFKPTWSVPEGGLLSWYAYNGDNAALTTGGEVRFFVKHYGVWLRD